jgi:hypothetical protein
MNWLLLLILTVLMVAGGLPARASFLDTYLNNLKLDQSSFPRASDRDGVDLAGEKRFGQTFVTGPRVREISRIAIQCPHYNPEWGEGVSLVLTLYDSPARERKLASFEMKYEWRSWEDMTIVFPLDAEAEPGRSYYYELTTKGGNGKVGKIMTSAADYPSGCAYMDGQPQEFDFAFQTYVHTDWDRDAAYREAFAMFDLDHPGLKAVKAAVEQKKWEDAAKALVAHFESRPAFREMAQQARQLRIPDMTLAELAADMKVRDPDGNIISLGPNWTHLRWWPKRGGVGLTREGIRKYLAAGYVSTGDRKYAVAWNEMLKAFFTELPSPLKSGIVPEGAKDIAPIFPGGLAGGTMWSGLAIGARLAHEFYYYTVFADAPEFTWDVRAAFIFNLGDMADVLAIQKGGGNWATQMFDHLFYFSTEFPEFARSKEYARLAFDGLIENMRETLQPDGPIGESAGYQMMVHGQYLDIMERARRFGLEIPQELVSRVEAALAFHLYTIQPDGLRPPFGDALADDARPLLKRGAETFGRKDMLWVATNGAEGSIPERLSVQFPHSGYYVMRSDWSPDARYLILRNGRYTAHGHSDALSFILLAYGNLLVADPGIYIYGTPDAVRLISTRSHSTISVDGADLENAGGPTTFLTGNVADYLRAEGPAYKNLDRTICPVRRIAFLRPDYWVISDIVRGSGEHQVDSRFHFGDLQAKLDPRTQIALTTRTSGGNLALIPAGGAETVSVLEEGDTAFVHEKLEPALILRRSVSATLPLRMDTVAYPFRGASPDASAAPLTPAGNASVETCGVRVTTPAGADVVVFSDSPGSEVSFTDAPVRLKGEFACVRRDPSGTLRGFAWAQGSRLEDGGLLAEASRTVRWLDVAYDEDTVRVTCEGGDASLRVAATGRKKAVVNGAAPRSLAVGQEFFSPFGD